MEITLKPRRIGKFALDIALNRDSSRFYSSIGCENAAMPEHAPRFSSYTLRREAIELDELPHHYVVLRKDKSTALMLEHDVLAYVHFVQHASAPSRASRNRFEYSVEVPYAERQ